MDLSLAILLGIGGLGTVLFCVVGIRHLENRRAATISLSSRMEKQCRMERHPDALRWRCPLSRRTEITTDA